jgi:tetratricopeptide (TPR) repeat protein
VTIAAVSRAKVQIEVEHRTSWRWWVVGGFVAVAAAAVGTFRFVSSLPPVLTDRDTVVLGNFANSTGDSVFDGTLRQAMAVELEQSPYISLVPDERLRRTMTLMGQPADAALNPATSLQICERVGSAAVLDGSIDRIGQAWVLALHARSCSSGASLVEEQVQVSRKEDVLGALSQMGIRFRRRVGEKPSTIENHNKPLPEATTTSLEALKAYSTAWTIHLRSGPIAAIPLLQRAIDLDPQFAMAWASLGRMNADLDESDQAAANLTKAWQLRDRTSDRERYFITAAYQMLTLGNMEEARQTCEAWAHAYPRDEVPHSWMGGMINKVGGRFEVAAAEARKAVDLDPDRGIAWNNIALNNVYLGRLDEAEKALQAAESRGLSIDEFFMVRFDIAFLRGDVRGMESVAQAARLRPGAEGWVTDKEARTAAWSGHLLQARSITHRAVEASRQVDQRERAALWLAAGAVRESLFGDTSEARRQAQMALADSNSREVEFGAAFALALSAEPTRTKFLSTDLDKRFPHDTLVQFNSLPTLRALLALSRHDPGAALEELRIAEPYELSPPRDDLGALYPAYVRGLALLALHRDQDAAREFQKVKDHAGIVGSDPVGVLARLQLARALTSFDRPKSLLEYRDLLNLWRNADPSLPPISSARREAMALERRVRSGWL